MNPYPVTIVATRYGGIYEGGPWAAYNCYPDEIPEDASDDDVTTTTWWDSPSVPVGVGATPDEALAALLLKLPKEPR